MSAPSTPDVIKIGGADGVDLDALLDDLAALWQSGRRFLIVHGGSGETNRLARALGHEPQMVTSPSGQSSRRTDRTMVEIFATATAGLNRRLVEGLRRRDIPALGLSGLDGGLLIARRKDTIRVIENGRQRVLRHEWTGRPESVDTALLNTLFDRGLLPVVAPVAGSAKGEMLNVDADRAAATFAAALGSRRLLLMTNVPGLLRDVDDPSSLLTHVPATAVDDAMAHAKGRMRKKVLAASEAVEGGVATVIIADGRVARPVTEALAGAGTLIGAALSREETAIEGEAAS